MTTLAAYAACEGLRSPDGADLTSGVGRCQAQARAIAIAAYALSEGHRVDLASEPGRSLSESEAARAVLDGQTVMISLR